MSDLTDARDHAQGLAHGAHRTGCFTRVPHNHRCRSPRCPGAPHLCDCEPPDTAERRMWQNIADELNAYLDHKATNDDPELPL